MDKLCIYYVDDNNSSNSPYYEPEFNSRSNKLRITVPYDPLIGSVYILQELFTLDDSESSFDHHYSLMELLSEKENELQLQLMAKPLAEFATLVLFKLGQVDMKQYQFEEIYTDPRTSNARFLALKMLQKEILFGSFLEEGFGFTERPIEWYTEPSLEFESAEKEPHFNLCHVTDKASFFINEGQFDIEQFIDEQIFKHLNANTESILNITGFEPSYIFSAEDLIEILVASAGDPVYRVALEAVKTLQILEDSLPQLFANLLFSTKVHVHLADMFCARISYPYYNNFYESSADYYIAFMELFGQILTYENCISAVAETGLIKSLALLCNYVQLSTEAAECLLEAAITSGQSVSCMISSCKPELPLIILRNTEFGRSEQPMRLCAMLLQNSVICELFADSINEFFELCKDKEFSAQSVLPLINKASSVPRAEVRISLWLKESEDLQQWIGASYQPETSDILIKQDYIRNEVVLDAKINCPHGALK